MVIKLTNWQYAVAAYAVVILALLVAVITIVEPPLSERAALLERLEDLESQVVRFREVVAEGVRAAEESRRLESQGIEQDRFLHGETDAIVSADLQSLISDVVEVNGGRVISTALRETDASLLFTTISATAQVRSSMEALTRILHALEGGRPELTVENLTIRSRYQERRQIEAADELDVTFDVTGYLYDEMT